MQENIHFLSGLDRCKKGQFEEAIPFFTKSLEVEPYHVPSLYNRGLSYIKIGKFVEALADFDKGINLSPKGADLYGDRGVAKHLLGNQEAALVDMDKAQELDPANPYRYSARAYILAQLGKLPQAIDDYKKAIELDPEDEVAYNNLGLLEEQLGYKELSKKRFETADRLAGDDKKEFPKPNIDQLIEEHRKEKDRKQKAVDDFKERLEEQAVISQASAKTRWEIIGEIFTSKDTFREFLDFVMGGFKMKE